MFDHPSVSKHHNGCGMLGVLQSIVAHVCELRKSNDSLYRAGKYILPNRTEPNRAEHWNSWMDYYDCDC